MYVYDFDPATGSLQLAWSDTWPFQFYGSEPAIAFSSDNSKLYATATKAPPTSTQAPTNILYQYDLSRPSPLGIVASRQILRQDTTGFITDMQIAIDGKLYFVRQPIAPNWISYIEWLSSIECPNAVGAACDIRLNSLYLNGMHGSWYLPTQDQTIFRNANHIQAAADPPVICGGDSTQLVAYGGAATTVRWFPATGLSSDTARNPTAAPRVTTTYTVIAQRTCGPPDTARVRVMVTAGARVVDAGADTTVCAGATMRLGGPAPDPTAAYLWGPTRYLSGPRSPRPLFTAPLVRRDTTLTYVVRAYCTALPPDTVWIRVRALPVLTPLPALTACPADRLVLGAPAQPGATYQWAPAALLSGATTAQPLFAVPAAPPSADTTYVFRRTLAAAGGACPVTDSVRVVVRGHVAAPELLSLSVDTLDERRMLVGLRVALPGGYGGSAPLALQVAPAPGEPFGGGAPLALPAAGALSTQPVPAAAVGAVYRLRATTPCDTLPSAAHRPVGLRVEPTDSLGGGRLTWTGYRGWGLGMTYTVLAQADGAPGDFAPRWSGTDSTLVVAPAPGPPTRYRVRATAPDGRRSESNSVLLTARPGLRAYNILTPDGDGRNDGFVVEYLDYYPAAELSVYSRWGERVYTTAAYRSGQWRAEGLAAGLYYYLLRLPDGRSWRGWVEVVR